MSRIREQVVLLGRRKSLVSILTQSTSATADADRPAIVIMNAGIIHRVGPNRLFVGLARELAAAGYLVARFDLSGIGDSEPRADGLAPLPAALADIREVLDSLQTTRAVQRVVLIGLCSGADQSIVYGGEDERVVGMALIDPTVPRTGGYYLRLYRDRVFNLRSWMNVASGRHPVWKQLSQSLAAAGDETPAGVEARPQPQPQEPQELENPQLRASLEAAYGRVVAAGVELLTVFTGGRQDQHNHPEQLFEAFPKVPFGKLLRLEYLPAADHTFSALAARARLTTLIAQWLGDRIRPLPDAGTSFARQPPVQS